MRSSVPSVASEAHSVLPRQPLPSARNLPDADSQAAGHAVRRPARQRRAPAADPPPARADAAGPRSDAADQTRGRSATTTPPRRSDNASARHQRGRRQVRSDDRRNKPTKDAKAADTGKKAKAGDADVGRAEGKAKTDGRRDARRSDATPADGRDPAVATVAGRAACHSSPAADVVAKTGTPETRRARGAAGRATSAERRRSRARPQDGKPADAPAKGAGQRRCRRAGGAAGRSRQGRQARTTTATRRRRIPSRRRRSAGQARRRRAGQPARRRRAAKAGADALQNAGVLAPAQLRRNCRAPTARAPAQRRTPPRCRWPASPSRSPPRPTPARTTSKSASIRRSSAASTSSSTSTATATSRTQLMVDRSRHARPAQARRRLRSNARCSRPA